MLGASQLFYSYIHLSTIIVNTRDNQQWRGWRATARAPGRWRRCSRRQNVKRHTQVHFLWRSTPQLLTPPSPKRTQVDILFVGPSSPRSILRVLSSCSLHEASARARGKEMGIYRVYAIYMLVDVVGKG